MCAISLRGSHRQRDRQFHCGEQSPDAGNIRCRNVPQFLRQLGRQHAAGRHRLAVHPGAVAHFRFDGVTEGVAQIEQRADTQRFALVALHHVGLDTAGMGDHPRQDIVVAGVELVDVALQLGQMRCVEDQRMLDDLGKTRGVFTWRQAFQAAVSDNTACG